MPFRRTYRGRGGRGRRFGRRMRKAPWYSRKYSVGALASKAWSTAKYLKSLVNVEFKYSDTGLSYTQGSNAETITSLSQINQGATAVTRTGNSIKATALYVRGSIADTSGGSSITRVIIGMYKENGVPSRPEIIKDLNINSLRELTYTDDVVVFYDKLLTCGLGTNGIIPFKFYKKLSSHIKYDGTTITPVNNSLWILTLNSYGTTGATGASISLQGRVRFIDN